MDFAQQSLVDDAFDGLKLAGKSTFETDTGPDLRGPNRLFNRQAIFPIQGKRLFNDKVLPSLCRRDRMPRMVLWVTADGNDINLLIRQHRTQLPVAGDGPSVTRTDLDGIERATGTNGGHPPLGGGIYGVDMSATHPPVPDNPNIILFRGH
jgi:hypothetical protein